MTLSFKVKLRNLQGELTNTSAVTKTLDVGKHLDGAALLCPLRYAAQTSDYVQPIYLIGPPENNFCYYQNYHLRDQSVRGMLILKIKTLLQTSDVAVQTPVIL